MRFILFVGANNSLAPAEVSVQIPSSVEILPSVFLFDEKDSDLAINKVSRLGCGLKLAVEVPGYSGETTSLADLIKHKNFSITQLGKAASAGVGQAIKNEMGKGRFILAKDSFGLSPIILKKHTVDEFFVDTEKREVWQTIWFHDFRHWIEKDRHMPFADARAGMLPPKIARSMVNLVPFSTEKRTLIDPFCGSGRILIEAAELGFNVAGVDISEKQARETELNLKSLDLGGRIEVLDATHLSTRFSEVDAIVTEPFLGKPNYRPDQVRYIVPGLEKLYLGALKDWTKVLKIGGLVVMVFPILNDGKKVYKTSHIIDEKLKLSYNPLKRDIIYSRPGADTKREIVILQKI